jgi:uncharacterized membrane protein
VLGVAAYPFAVYFGLGRFSPRLLVVGLVALLGLRMILSREDARRTRLSYIVGIAGLLILAARSPAVGLKAYPILISLTLAIMFTYSLIWPPTIIEQLVRVRRSSLLPPVVAYLRNVTIVWTGFFLINAAISAATAISGSMKLWTLYNGFISYLIIGALLLGEFALRPGADDRSGRA